MNLRNPFLRLGIAAAVVLFLDRISKVWVLQKMVFGESIPVAPFFHFTYVTNTGTAFGLFQGQNLALTVLSVLILGGLIYFSRSLIRENERWVPLAIGLIIGGAIGNIWDRWQYNAVIDFLDFRVWPVFNVADSAITVGTILLIFTTRTTNHVSDPT